MTLSLAHLWLPILLSAAAVWFWSFLSWAILSVHKGDFGGVPNEDEFLSALKPLNLKPGNYGFPHCESHAKSKDPAFVEKWKTGPAGLLNVWKPNPNMGLNMLLSFIVYLIVSLLIAYVGVAAALPRGAGFAKVFQVLGTVGILSYSFAFLPTMIWFQASRNAKITGVLDGVISGLATGAIFAVLWPS